MGAVIDIARRFGDSLTNLVSRMGTPADKAAHGVYGLTLLTDPEIMNAYRGAWLPRKIVDIPAMDSCRKWRNWQAEADQIETIEAEENRLNVRGKVLEARIKARLWGGSAILIGTGDNDLMEPLNVDRIGTAGLRYLTVFTRRQLTAGEIDRDPTSEFYGKPMSYTVRGNNGLSMQVHLSRLAVFQGNAAADDELTVQQGWGDSVLVSVLNAVKNADSTAGNIASLVFEAKVDIIRSPNFMASLADPEYADRWLKRFSLANMAKGVNGVLMLDKDEEYESKSTSFATLPDILDRFLQIVSGAADIPATRLLGQSPAGLASTGESDLRNYYDRISAMQEIEMTPAMHRMDEAIIRSALGARPPEVHYIWSSLWQISDKERADIGKIDAETIAKLNETGLWPSEALAKAGANMLVEHSIMPGLQEAIDEAGGLPDYDMEAEAEAERQRLQLEAANTNREQRLAANDAAPRTLYVRRDVLNVKDIERWAKAQGFTDIVPDLHVTIAYSRQPVDWFKVGTSWSEKVEIGAGGPRQMERLGPDGKYIALLITANELVWRHREIVELGASWDWPDYQPHISIQVGGDVDLAKVEPYQGKIVLGPEMFEEVRTD
jgi:phage-related protein (TIGR01555 family)